MEILTIQNVTVVGILLIVVIYLVRGQVVPKDTLIQERVVCAERLAEHKATNAKLQEALDEMTAKCFELTAMARGYEHLTDVAVSAVKKGRQS